ncbi:MAG: hypothetical protein NC828_01530 [Candidatus Omnitrophica bacterium]|nr:hypothetical protein [Candidatus Omnitrophota bacterium]
MEKKPSPNNLEADIQPRQFDIFQRLSKASGKIFSIIKLLIGLCLLIFVYASSKIFLQEFNFIDKKLQGYFWWGIIWFLLIYLFIWEPALVYQKGHRILELIFSFFKPLVRVAPYVLPIYTIILFFAYLSLSLFIKSNWLVEYFIFSLGFSLALHLVFCAKSIRTRKDFLKANYLFGFSFVYVINVILLAFFLNIIFKEFSLVSFFNKSWQLATGIFYSVFKQLFLR